MRALLGIPIACLLIYSAIAQTTSSNWQVGTITAVKPHVMPADQKQGDKDQYEVSVKVDQTTYVVMFTDPQGVGSVQYRAGMSVAVHVADDTLTFNDALGRATKLPIIRREAVEVPKAQ